jgi:nitrate/nitrite transporter NarK
MINSIGNLGGYFGPDLVGAIRQANGGDATAAFLVLSVAALICAVLTFLIASPRPAGQISAAT